MKSAYKQLVLLLSLLLAVTCNNVLAAKSQNTVNTDHTFERASQAYELKDYVLARQLFEPLAEAGHAKAQFYMGAIYDKGLGVERDLAQAMFWFERSAEQGDVQLQHNLGLLYLQGKDIDQDYHKAVYWWHKAAEAGFAQSQYNLALLYLSGKGITPDDNKAVGLFKLAAEQGLREAQYALGLAYTLGRSVPLDFEIAYRLFELSAQQGFASAQYNLAALTENGEGTDADINKALNWYRKAAEQGHKQAQQRLAQLENKPVSATLTTPASRIIHDQAWIKNQPATHYTIQINTSQNEASLIRWLKQQQSLAPLAYFPQQQNDQVVYKAIYGSFVDQAAAQKALNKLPDALRKSKPWLRQFSGVQEQMHHN